MKLAMIGLGRMGGNMARRLIEDQHEIVAYDHDAAAVEDAARHGAIAASSLADAAAKLASPAIYWLMVPAGELTEKLIGEIAEIARKGDVIIDGGNSYWKDDIRRAKELAAMGIHYVDVGVSGGIWGLTRGYCLMIGGEADIVDQLDPLFLSLAPGMGTIPRTEKDRPHDHMWKAEHGYVHAGPAGAGHFTKMVHNGIEYGMMQAYAEGFDVLRQRASESLPEDQRYNLDLADIAEVWRRGSVISSWLLDLVAEALSRDASLSQFSGRVADSGEGRWTMEAAMEERVPVDVLAASLFARYRSRIEFSFADQLLSAMRFGFGGHVEVPQ